MNTSEQTSTLIKSLITAKKKIFEAKISLLESGFETLKNSERDASIDEVKLILQTESILIEQVSGQALNGHIRLTTRLVHTPSNQWIEGISNFPYKLFDSDGSDNMEYLKSLSAACMLCI